MITRYFILPVIALIFAVPAMAGATDPDIKPVELQPVMADFKPIPTRKPAPNDGDFHGLWSPLLQLEAVYTPSFILDSFPLPETSQTARSINIKDLNEKVLYVQADFNGSLERFNVLYTDTRLFNDPTVVTKHNPLEYLKEVLYDTQSGGVAFNPPSRVMNRDVGDVTYLFKTGIAEVIGFLESKGLEPSNRPYHELALEAAKQNKPFQVLYYWARSFRTPRADDDWKQAELVKVQAYHELNFPGSRERALGELKWFLETHGANPEGSALLQKLVKAPG